MNKQLNISQEAWNALEEIRELCEYETLEETLGHALGDQLFFARKRKQGHDILTRYGDQYYEVVILNSHLKNILS